MSEQKHTPEPWHIDAVGNIWADTKICNMREIADRAESYRAMTESEHRANARRIVACVNACAGVPTHELEQATYVAAVRVTLAKYRTQRDQLLEALKVLHKVIDSAGVMSLMNGVELGPVAWAIKANDAMEYAGEVIAAVEGGNQS